MGNLSNRPAAGLAVLLVTVIAACGSQARIEKLYQDPDVGEVQYQRLLVIGIAGDSDQRRRIEDLLAAGLAAEKVTAIPGYTRLGPSPALLQDDIELAAAATDSDGILIAHLVSVSTKAEVRTDWPGRLIARGAGSYSPRTAQFVGCRSPPRGRSALNTVKKEDVEDAHGESASRNRRRCSRPHQSLSGAGIVPNPELEIA